jgi:hypothetical protein
VELTRPNPAWEDLGHSTEPTDADLAGDAQLPRDFTPVIDLKEESQGAKVIPG